MSGISDEALPLTPCPFHSTDPTHQVPLFAGALDESSPSQRSRHQHIFLRRATHRRPAPVSTEQAAARNPSALRPKPYSTVAAAPKMIGLRQQAHARQALYFIFQWLPFLVQEAAASKPFSTSCKTPYSRGCGLRDSRWLATAPCAAPWTLYSALCPRPCSPAAAAPETNGRRLRCRPGLPAHPLPSPTARCAT